jgi:hypothetical protein
MKIKPMNPWRDKRDHKGPYHEPLILHREQMVINRNNGRPGIVTMVITSKRYLIDYGIVLGRKVERVTTLEPVR